MEEKPISEDMITKDAFIAMMKLDELLILRESKEESLRHLNRLIMQGLGVIDEFPRRWYVKDPTMAVIGYLERKYGQKLNHDIHNPIHQKCGYGELNGHIAFVPHDIDYSWRITQGEFHAVLSKMDRRKMDAAREIENNQAT
jgi:hypothetical protein